jgi:hypothetical protein
MACLDRKHETINPALLAIDTIGQTVMAALGIIPTPWPGDIADKNHESGLARAAD